MVTTRECTGIVFIFLILTVVFTYPLIVNFSNGLPGLHFNPDVNPLTMDTYIFLWNFWWAGHAIGNLKNPFHTGYLYYPFGADLYFHTFVPVKSIVSAPLTWFLPLPVVFNIHIFLTFILTGLGAYAWLKYMTNDARGAFFGALIISFAPYRMIHAPFHLNLLSTEGIFFTLYFFHRYNDDVRFRHGLLCSLCFAYTFYCSPFYAICMIVYICIYYIWRFLCGDLYIHTTTFIPLLIYGGIAFLFILPFLVPMISSMQTEGYAQRLPGEAALYSLEIMSYFTPAPFHPLWDHTWWPIYRRHDISGYFIEGTAFLGFLPLLFACIGLLSVANRRWGFLIAVCAVFFVLSLGPYRGCYHLTKLPFYYVSKFPGFDVIRTPARFQIMVLIPIAAMAAYGFSRCFSRMNVTRSALLIIPATLVLFEFSMYEGFSYSNPMLGQRLNECLH